MNESTTATTSWDKQFHVTIFFWIPTERERDRILCVCVGLETVITLLNRSGEFNSTCHTQTHHG